MLPAFVFEFVFSQSPFGEYLVSASDDPVILAVNDAFLRASGRTRESLVGQRLFAAFPSNPEDPGDTGVLALRNSLARAIATGRVDQLPFQRYPIRVLRSDGVDAFEERYWRAVNIPIFDETGALVCIAHRAEDVTEQAQTAQAHKRSIDRQSFQLALSDRLRNLTSPEEIAIAASSMLSKKLNITRVTYLEVDDVSGTFSQRHWPDPTRPQLPSERRRIEEFGKVIVDSLGRGEPLVIRDVVTDPRTAEHAQAYASIGVRSSLAIPLVKSGHLIFVLTLQHEQPREWSEFEIELATEVAERTWSSAENARAQEELRQANRRKDEFLAMLAHELRNPLAPISVAADLLAHHRLDEARLQKTSAIISRQVRHMTDLVDDLLDVSRVTRGLATLAEAPHGVKAIVGNAVEQARPLIEANRHRLTLDLPSADTTVLGDAKRLIQVVSNLLNNAAKYTPPGGHVQLFVTVDHEHVRIHVKDNGIGIPKDVQPRIFELFAQAERTPDRSQGGLGLGLALVKSLVELHRGSVSVLSNGPGTGSCFTVTLPRIEPLSFPSAGGDESPGPAPTRSLDVLVVDDNADAAEMLKFLLESAGHRVRVEYDPVGALDSAAASPPQAAFIDIGLPSMDGYEVVRRLRSSPLTAGAVYVALTGYGQEADRNQALAAGFDEHLVKPADPGQLLSILERVPGSRSAGATEL